MLTYRITHAGEAPRCARTHAHASRLICLFRSGAQLILNGDPEQSARGGVQAPGTRGRVREKSHPNNFHPVGAEMQMTDQRGLEWKIARLEENITEPGLYMYVEDVRETCWTQVMELTCTGTLTPAATTAVIWFCLHCLSVFLCLQSFISNSQFKPVAVSKCVLTLNPRSAVDARKQIKVWEESVNGTEQNRAEQQPSVCLTEL